MCTFSSTQLAGYYGTSVRTFQRHVAELKAENKFTRTSKRQAWNELEATQLSELLHFTIPELSTNTSVQPKQKSFTTKFK